MNKNKVIKKSYIAKKTIFLFKKFARKNKFWEEYKNLSKGLKKASFVKLVEKCEPVQLIQSSEYFCSWPRNKANNGILWRDLSYEWAKICSENELWYDVETAQSFCSACITSSRGKKVDLSKKY